MQPTNGQPRLSSEMMATGDALRHCIIQVNTLAEALEVLAQRLGITS